MVSEPEKLIVDGLLNDVRRFLDWAKHGLLPGLSSMAQITGVLKNEFKIAAEEAGTLPHPVRLRLPS